MTRNRILLSAVVPASILLLVAGLAAPSGSPAPGLERGEEKTGPAARDAESDPGAGRALEAPASEAPRAEGNRAAGSRPGSAATASRAAFGRSAEMRLQRVTDTTVEALYRGSKTPIEVLEEIRSQSDPEVASALFDALQEAEELLDEESLSAWLELALHESEPGKRYWAIQSLGLVTDETGRIRTALFDLARNEEGGAREAALDGLFEYVDMNPEAAAEVARFAFDLAGSSSDPEVRARAISVVDPSYLDRAAVERVGSFLREGSAEVRFAAAGVLGLVRAEDRAEALRILEEAYATEEDAMVRRSAIQSIVQAGGSDALGAIERLRDGEDDDYVASVLEDYLTVLQTGEIDLERIEERLQAIQDRRYGEE